ncbi:bifunctional diguanylate cyclase/phosphodiesterase [Acinetobacter sp. ANC 5502]
MPEKNNNLDALFILELFGKRAGLEVVLNAVSDWLEGLIPDAMVSIMLFSEEEQHLNLISCAQHFSSVYRNVLNNLKIGPNVGACGAAAYHREVVICEDLTTHPNCVNYQEVIQKEGIAACWSFPIINAEGTLYGTFGTYYRKSKTPTENEIKILHHAASLTALGMDLHYERQHRNAMNDKYHSFFNHYPNATYEHDLKGNIIKVNMTSKLINGFEIEQILGLHYLQFTPPEYTEITARAFNNAVEGQIQRIEIQVYSVTGQTYWADLTYLPILQHKEIVGVFAIIRDISKKRQIEGYLHLLKRGLDASLNGIVITEFSENHPIVYVNPAFSELTGYSEIEILGKNCRFLQGEKTDLISVQQIRQALQDRREIKTTLKNYRKNGTWFWNQLTLSPVLDEDGKCTHFIGIQQDVTQQRIDEEYINYQRTHDSLTDLVNRQTFEELLDSAFHVKGNINNSLVVLYIDIDEFRTVNEELGYSQCDVLIKLIAERLRSVVQENDILSRFAVDGFSLLLNKRDVSEEIVQISEEILRLLSLPFNTNGHHIYLTASIGIASDTAEIENSRELLHNAMLAMHKAKAEGRNTWIWHTNSKNCHKNINNIQLRHELMIALQKEQFKLLYQPIIDTVTSKVMGVEALIRWHHPERGLISPASFIPLAERTGQIIAIGNWVLQQACKDIAELNRARMQPLSVAVNISPLQFRRADFLTKLREVLLINKLPPELIKVEVTEGMLITGAERPIEILNSIRALGIKVSIDDFGTGYSSLSYLRQLPIDEIKLDRGFIQHLPEQHYDAAIVTAIISMANTLNLSVVAEGVETEAQAQFLTQHKCNYLQGYYFSKPIPLEALKDLLENYGTAEE